MRHRCCKCVKPLSKAVTAWIETDHRRARRMSQLEAFLNQFIANCYEHGITWPVYEAAKDFRRTGILEGEELVNHRRHREA